MAYTQDQISEHIKTMHLFRKLGAEEVEKIAALLQPVELPKGEVLFHQGDPATSLYIVFSGRVRVTQTFGKEVRQLASWVEGDYFGMEALLKNQRRNVSVSAEENTVLLRLPKERMIELLKKMPGLRLSLEVAITSRHLAQRVSMPWLNPDEIVYFMARKHPFFLMRNLILPLLLLLAAMTLFVIVMVSSMGLWTAVGVAGLGLAALLWAGWSLLDWSNDYYLVTSQRVVWLEKIVGIYDSRDEAPLSTLLSVSVNTDQLGRIFDYGDVVMRTYTGPIIFHHVNHPNLVAPIIEEHWFRARISSKEAESQKINQAIRQRLGLETPQADILPTPQSQVKPAQATVAPGFFQRLFANFYRMRFEEGGVVTYRKHWFVLITKTWQPAFWLLVGIAVGVLRLLGYLALFSVQATLLVDGIFMFFVLLWYLYQYVDWRNDIYQLTPDQVVDIYRKPLGREEKRSAPLESILSIEYSRANIIGLLLNYGTVRIRVGTAELTFDNVYNPSQVQQDIFRRMLEHIERKKEQDAAAERERVSEWIATYHRTVEEMRRQQKPPDSIENSG